MLRSITAAAMVFAVPLVWLLCACTPVAGDGFSPPAKLGAAKGHSWRLITFADPSSSVETRDISFIVRPGDKGEGLCLLITFGDHALIKAHMISARLYREDGEIVDSVGGTLNAPVPEGVTASPSVPGRPSPQPSAWDAETSFPWGKNNLDESWIVVSMGQEHYCLEIPYGFDRNPREALPPAVTATRPHFAAPISKPSAHDHIVPWDQVAYDVMPVANGYSISLDLSNPGDAIGKLVLYQEKGAWDLHTPRTFLTAIDSDGSEIGSRCTGIRLDEDLAYGRDDSFSFNRYPSYKRGWGQLEIKVGAERHRIVVPSSIYEFGQGHPSLK